MKAFDNEQFEGLLLKKLYVIYFDKTKCFLSLHKLLSPATSHCKEVYCFKQDINWYSLFLFQTFPLMILFYSSKLSQLIFQCAISLFLLFHTCNYLILPHISSLGWRILVIFISHSMQAIPNI